MQDLNGIWSYVNISNHKRAISVRELGPVVNILAIFSYANILKIERIKGIGSPLLISFDKETEK